MMPNTSVNPPQQEQQQAELQIVGVEPAWEVIR